MWPFLLFICVLFIIFFCNKWIPVGVAAISGAIIAIIFGFVEILEAKELLLFIANPTITLLLIVIISLILEKIGFFDYFAQCLIKLTKGRLLYMYFSIIFIGAVLASFFTNDGAILILTPLVLSKTRLLSIDTRVKVAFLMAACFIADTSSLTFTISNLTNILTISNFAITFNDFFSQMVLVNLVSVFMSTFMLWLVFRKDLAGVVNIDMLSSKENPIKEKRVFTLALILLPLLFLSFFLLGSREVESSFILLPFTLIFFITAFYFDCIKPKEIIAKTPFNVIFFSLGMYLLVLGLKQTPFFSISGDFLTSVKEISLSLFLFVNAIYVAVLSCIFNNLPAVLASFIYEGPLRLNNHTKELFSLSTLIGANIGSKITPFGALSTMLWFSIIKKSGIHISWRYYIKKAFFITVPTLAITLIFFIIIN